MSFFAVNPVEQQTVAGKLANRRYLRNLCGVAITTIAFLSLAVPAAAVASGPGLTIHAMAVPTRFSVLDNATCIATETFYEPEACDGFEVTVTNSGGHATSGPVVLSERLPAGLTVVGASLFLAHNQILLRHKEPAQGEEVGSCEKSTPVRCEFGEELQPDQRLQMDIHVELEAGAVGAVGEASVSEAGTVVASTEASDVVSGVAPPFGLTGLVSEISGAGGAADVQAGDHPFEYVSRIDFDTKMGETPETGGRGVEPTSVGGGVRDVVVDLPPGFLGSAVAAPKCSFGELQSIAQCPADTLVGHISTEPSGLEVNVNSPLWNMVPERGVAAEFGYVDLLHGTHVITSTLAPTPAGYVLQAVGREVPDLQLWDVTTTFYGDPAAKNEGGATPAAMFTSSSDCSGEPLVTTAYVDSWEAPGAFDGEGRPEVEGPGWSAPVSTESPPVTGCDALHFDPESFTFAPESEHSGADEPSGYESVLKIPQSETPETLATPPLKTAVVTLPQGVAISPSAANGLVGCQETGGEGMNFESAGPGYCPAASKVGTAEVATPLLEDRLNEGNVFVAQPSCGGSGQPECSEALAEEGKLFALYLEIGSAQTGIHVKIRGKVEVGGNGAYSKVHGLAPGQVRTSFIDAPQTPFSELKLKFNGGPRAPLANPQVCGTFTTYASLEPWSAPESGPNAIEQPSFNINGNCSDGFAPSFTAGMTTTLKAGAYSAFAATFSRHDTEQDLSGVTVNMPPGLLGKIAGIKQCGEAEANAGTCPAASKVGTATAAAGAGSDPFWQSGNVYLTGPYHGAPFGLSVVVPAKAGPYNLGNIVVRAAISIHPNTAQVTVTSNPLPQSIDGVPLRVQTVNVTVGQENNFTFNATNCSPSSVSATLSSAQGATAPVSSAYEPSGCAGMKFKPVLSASTAGKASKAGGASLDVKVVYPPGSAGTYANIKSVKVDLPKQLPSRLTTLQKACLAKVFEANPANCPAASDVGTATAGTPLLSVPLSGPAYLVSHGGEAFPDLEVVLQGEGITIVLDGNTDIKKGITSSTFKAVPDAPVSSFELKLPTGKFSILGSNVGEKAKYSLCGQALNMPTEITAQNGTVIKQTTKIAVTGCPNSISISSHKVKGKTTTLSVYVPAAGKLTATGKGLSSVTKTYSGQEAQTFTLTQKKAGKLKTKIKLTFTPSKGKKQTKSIAISFKK